MKINTQPGLEKNHSCFKIWYMSHTLKQRKVKFEPQTKPIANRDIL